MKTSQWVGIVVCVALVAACASAGDVRMKGAAFEGSSAKSAKVVAGCIADKWEGGGPPARDQRETYGERLLAHGCI